MLLLFGFRPTVEKLDEHTTKIYDTYNSSRPTSYLSLRDWSLITGRGGLQNGKTAVRNFLRHPLKTG